MTLEAHDQPATPVLTSVQARVLATLMEKARTVPDSYPLSLNSLLAGCNQKSSRDPVMQLDEAQALAALHALEALGLAQQGSGHRVPRWEHRFERALGVPAQSAALLGLLMLRGPQTAAELRLNAERWHPFADTSSVLAFLDELQHRSEAKGGPLVQRLPVAPGAREPRWVHLLCGPAEVMPEIAAETSQSLQPTLQQQVAALQQQVAVLENTVRQLCVALERVGVNVQDLS